MCKQLKRHANEPLSALVASTTKEKERVQTSKKNKVKALFSHTQSSHVIEVHGKILNFVPLLLL